jgi:hypothetical protein
MNEQLYSLIVGSKVVLFSPWEKTQPTQAFMSTFFLEGKKA